MENWLVWLFIGDSWKLILALLIMCLVYKGAVKVFRGILNKIIKGLNIGIDTLG